ncbi:hypothetical protein LOC68_01705 [Blastopirellula sp. JC732]|uniref:Uncharacterized protein n=1 Tax=Blastopirellula sediminis TaxID=2894196 RepID=A0A9X1MIX9_9BACT|nr:hypothetical protein [Blastopirellula sediminis]MCC9608097.1 hypothetical protein [Blastopirellula sediminis]MCC9627110.1 hypothetical protein [Blastopirellula sediminis]
MNEEKAILQQWVESLQRSFREAEAEKLADLEARIADLQRQLAAVEQGPELGREISDLQDEVMRLEKDVSQLETERDQHQHNAEQLCQRLTAECRQLVVCNHGQTFRDAMAELAELTGVAQRELETMPLVVFEELLEFHRPQFEGVRSDMRNDLERVLRSIERQGSADTRREATKILEQIAQADQVRQELLYDLQRHGVRDDVIQAIQDRPDLNAFRIVISQMKKDATLELDWHLCDPWENWNVKSK